VTDESPEATGLFPELPAPGQRQFEITASLEGRAGPSMHIVVPEAGVEGAFGMAFDACLAGPKFELTIRPLGPAAP
jgi:hypothetical protein